MYLDFVGLVSLLALGALAQAQRVEGEVARGAAGALGLVEHGGTGKHFQEAHHEKEESSVELVCGVIRIFIKEK